MTDRQLGSAIDEPSALAILRFMCKSRGTIGYETSARTTLLRSGSQSIEVPTTLFEDLIGENLIEVRRDRCKITKPGRNRIKSDLAGREPSSFRHSESPLDRLFRRRQRDGKSWLCEAEFEAGERLRRDFEFARLQPRISSDWNFTIPNGNQGAGGGGAELSEAALDARKRVEKALGSLQATLAGIVLDVCCFLKGLEQVERERQWPPRSAKVMLKAALSSLAGHYGLIAEDRSPGKIVHWGDGDYRPNIRNPSDTF